MMRSLWSAVSGLKTHQTEMDVIGNNIANVNTTAYKSQATGFNDILYQTVREGSAAGQTVASTNTSQVGLGTRVASIYTNIASQGSAITTNNSMDFMINGDQFFIFDTDAAAADGLAYGRDGSFMIDSDGCLVTQASGYYVQGLMGDREIPEGGNLTVERLELVNEKTKYIGGTATREAYIKGNIDRDDSALEEGRPLMLDVYGADGNTYTLKFKITDAGDTADNTYKATIDEIIDSDGNRIENSYGEQEVTLVYNMHDGTLENIVKDLYYTFGVTGQETDAQGNVVATDFAYKDTVGYITQEEVITGTDGENYLLTFSMYRDYDTDADYIFSLDSATKLTGAGRGTTTEIEDVKAALDFSDATGMLVSVDGERKTEFSFEFADEVLPLGNLNFDFSEAVKNLNDARTVDYHFGGDADGKLGDTLIVDFGYTTNYAGAAGGHHSTLSAYKGNDKGQNRGYASGEMSGLSFSDNGGIFAQYTNGQTVKIAQMVFATFNNAMGLEKIGENLYAASLSSGAAVPVDIVRDGGSLSSGVLEGSNVNLAKEFTDMITTQRGFQANSKVITTSDEMLQILRGLKR